MWKNINASHAKSSIESALACMEDIPFDFKRDKVLPQYGMWKNRKASHAKSSMEKSALACMEDIPFDFKEIKLFHNMECGRI